MSTDILNVSLLRKKINEDTYIQKYVYSLENEKLLEPKNVEKRNSGYEDSYSLLPGKYIIIEININGVRHDCGCKCLVVFSREDFLNNKRRQFPGANIEAFKKVYQYGGWEIGEWEGCVPNWVELCECLYYLKCDSDDDIYNNNNNNNNNMSNDVSNVISRGNEYKQTQEVEDKLSQLLPQENDGPKSNVQYLIKKVRKEFR